MGSVKLDRPHRLALLGAAVLMLASVSILVGTTLARYRYRETTDMLFAPKAAPQVYLFADAAFAPLPETFTEGAEGKTLTFVVSNGESAKDFAAEDQFALVRLYGSLGLGAGENLTAVLTVDGIQYTAVPRKVDVDSPIHKSFGEGWVYCFMDSSGNELRWLLAGGQHSSEEMQLTVNTQAGLDTSLLRLMVTSQTQ